MCNSSSYNSQKDNKVEPFISSPKIWPTFSNPANIFNVVVEFCPDRIYESLPQISVKSKLELPEVCPKCKHPIDSHFSREKDGVKCFWCTKTFRPINFKLAEQQINYSSFVHKFQKKEYYFFKLFFIIDGCCGEEHFQTLKNCLFKAIDSLDNNQDFVVAILTVDVVKYLVTYKNVVVAFDIPFNQDVCLQLNMNNEVSNKSSLNAISKYINGFQPYTQGSQAALDGFLGQLVTQNDEITMISRVVLFSPCMPKYNVYKNLTIDMITPLSIDSYKDNLKNIDGYFLSTCGMNELNQITNLMKKILKNNQRFNVKINASVSNYSIENKSFNYSSIQENFIQTFHLQSNFKLSPLSTSIFGVELEYLNYNIKSKKFAHKLIWVSQSFQKSGDFISVANTINPFLVIPYFNDHKEVIQFNTKLIDIYKKYCLPQIIKEEEEDYFSAIPILKWFLRYQFNQYQIPEAKTPYYCSMESRIGKYYPIISFWEDTNYCIKTNCVFDKSQYELYGSPNVVVVDLIAEINIYSIKNINFKNTKIIEQIQKLKNERFPRPHVKYYPISDYVSFISKIEPLSFDFYNNAKGKSSDIST